MTIKTIKNIGISSGLNGAKSLRNALPYIPSPGSVSSYKNYTTTIETFNSLGTFYPRLYDRKELNIEVLIIGGGAAGGSTISEGFGDAAGGGGGAGEYKYIKSLKITCTAFGEKSIYNMVKSLKSGCFCIRCLSRHSLCQNQ